MGKWFGTLACWLVSRICVGKAAHQVIEPWTTERQNTLLDFQEDTSHQAKGMINKFFHSLFLALSSFFHSKRDAGPGDSPPSPHPFQGPEEREMGIHAAGVSRQPWAVWRRSLRAGLWSLHLRETLLGGGCSRRTVLRRRGQQRVSAEEGTRQL